MKVILSSTLLLALLSGAARAFAPQSATPLRVAASTTAIQATEPFGVLPPTGMLGRTEWDKFTTVIGSEETGTYLQASEIKHGRSAMLAVLGFSFQKFGITFDKFSPHEYLSVTQGIKFSDLAALGPIEAVKAVPVEGLAQVFAAIAAVEIYELTHRDGELKRGESVAPGLRPGGLTGDLGWNPLRVEVTDKLRLNEISNGRAAMVAISAWVCHDLIPGSVPIPLPW
jgi:hypothetical protein